MTWALGIPMVSPMKRRLVAIFALVVAAATLALAHAVGKFPRGLVLLGWALVAAVATRYGRVISAASTFPR
jgi:hypothetical protein